MSETAEIRPPSGATDMYMRARYFAEGAHGAIGQKRKYTGQDYITHPVEVAGILIGLGFKSLVIQAALLHDVLEDTQIRQDTILTLFGAEITRLVVELTDVSKPTDGTRAERKKLDREHSAQASADAQSIKLADLISNTRSIVAHDKAFAKVYLEEKALLIEVLTKADPRLIQMAKDQLAQALEDLAK